jgi:hypothetical protein
MGYLQVSNSTQAKSLLFKYPCPTYHFCWEIFPSIQPICITSTSGLIKTHWASVSDSVSVSNFSVLSLRLLSLLSLGLRLLSLSLGLRLLSLGLRLLSLSVSDFSVLVSDFSASQSRSQTSQSRSQTSQPSQSRSQTSQSRSQTSQPSQSRSQTSQTSFSVSVSDFSVLVSVSVSDFSVLVSAFSDFLVLSLGLRLLSLFSRVFSPISETIIKIKNPVFDRLG